LNGVGAGKSPSGKGFVPVLFGSTDWLSLLLMLLSSCCATSGQPPF